MGRVRTHNTGSGRRGDDRHRSREVIDLLNKLDDYYPNDGIIRLVLDNHEIHTSKATKTYLKSGPGRFVVVHTRQHPVIYLLNKCVHSDHRFF